MWQEPNFGKIKFDELGFLVQFKLDFYCLCSLQKSISNLIFQKSSKDQQGLGWLDFA